MKPTEDKYGRLDTNWSAGVSGFSNSSKQILNMKRTPLSTISENVCNSRTKSETKISNSISYYSSLECHENLTYESDSNESYKECQNISDSSQQQRSYWKSNLSLRDLDSVSQISSEAFFVLSLNQNFTQRTYESTSISPHMRSLLIEWMGDVSHSCEHAPETLFMAVNYLDRYLTVVQTEVDSLQLIGVTCLWISSKLNDVKVPQIREFSYLTDNACSVSQIIEAEKLILSTLEFNLICPTVLFFCELMSTYFFDVFQHPSIFLYMQALCEFTLVNCNLSTCYFPSILGAAILMVSSLHFDIMLPIENFSVFNLDLACVATCYNSLLSFIGCVDSCPFSNSVFRYKAFWYVNKLY